mmetsp:Transcript_17308/g.55112  ORF Transcript_17308/g.55112 Transcript_17308/m.55112 type:complete len:81 (-) Transcript_17308:208-450(-)
MSKADSTSNSDEQPTGRVNEHSNCSSSSNGENMYSQSMVLRAKAQRLDANLQRGVSVCGGLGLSFFLDGRRYFRIFATSI